MIALAERAGDWRSFEARVASHDEAGAGVVENCRRESQFRAGPAPDGFAEFLDAAMGVSAGSPRDSYEVACFTAAHQRGGEPASLPADTVFQRVVNLAALKRALHARLPTDAAKEAWRTLVDAVARGDAVAVDPLTEGVIAEMPLAHNRFQMFCTFYEGDPTSGERPIDGSVEELLDACGLPDDWEAYAEGQAIWRLRFQVEAAHPAHKPTVADAGWNAVFLPLPEEAAAAPWGRARGISGPRRRLRP